MASRTKTRTKKRREYGSGGVYLRGKTYWITYRVSGRKINESAETHDKKVAEQKLRERLVEVGRGEGGQFLGWSFRETANEWFRHISAPGTLAPSTLILWKGILDNHLMPVFGDDRLHQMADKHRLELYKAAKLTAYSEKLEGPLPVAGKCKPRPLSAQTVNHHITVLGMIFDWAKVEGRIASNPVRLIERPDIEVDEPEPFEREEVQAVLGALPAEEDRFLVLTMVSLGLRLGEALALKVSDYRRKETVLAVRRTLKRGEKGKYFLEGHRNQRRAKSKSASRELKLSEEFARLLEAHIASMREQGRIPERGTQLIFPNQSGKPKHPGNWRRRVWEAGIEQAGLWDKEICGSEEKPNPHRLRHTYASEQIAIGTPISDLAYRMGHASPQITLNLYTHIFRRQSKTAADSTALYLKPPEAANYAS